MYERNALAWKQCVFHHVDTSLWKHVKTHGLGLNEQADHHIYKRYNTFSQHPVQELNTKGDKHEKDFAFIMPLIENT